MDMNFPNGYATKMKTKTNRNNEIILLINRGISYRNIAKVLGIFPSVVERTNRVFNTNKESEQYCVKCGENTNLLLNGKIRNICRDCANIIKKIK